MAKAIKVSDDSGANWYTLPGGSGSINRDADSITDTTFGQTFESKQSGVIKWTVNAQAFYKGFAGYVADLKKIGSTTAFVSEAMTQVGLTKRYRITDATKSIWDRSTVFTVEDGAVDHTADVESFNWLFGEIVFKDTYAPTGAITVSGSYFPTAVLGKANTFTLTMSAAAIQTTDFNTAQGNNGFHTNDPGLRTVQLELGGTYALASGFAALLQSRDEIIVEINPDGNSKSVARGFFKNITQGQSGDVGALEEENVTFALSVPDPSSLTEFPFAWQHAADTTLSTAVKKCLDAWQNETKLGVQYLPDGATGDTGTAVVTEISLAGSLTGMNEFTAGFTGDGELTTV